MSIKKIETGFKDLFVLEPRIFRDARGYFLESFNARTMSEVGLNYNFVQDNESQSRFGTLRGLHFQLHEFAQAKLVRVTVGEVLDVVVDLRPGSETFGKHYSVKLSDENRRMMIIPRGFAHGFVVLSDNAIFAYKCDNYYSPPNESGLHYSDPDLAIDWGISPDKFVVSDKDMKNPSFKQWCATHSAKEL
jgi:dTDP-4-dehydrorhamnose 3,5-epimerase